MTTTRIDKPKPSKGWAGLSLHLGTPAGSGRIGTPYHSPSAEGHTTHTVVGRSPAPTIPVTASRIMITMKA